ncbi:MAG: hypothetical protein K6E85_06650 [Lachnospiraceae bacterium]|nr:hypothetical protein [Lachnospiraceae bacterium]
MDELKELLIKVKDSYFDFILGMLNYAGKKQSRCEMLTKFLKDNPDITTSDVIKYISDQPDFFDDAAPISAG